MGMMSSGLGLGFERGQYTSGHPPHGMLRQKSIGEAVCFYSVCHCPPVCLSSGPVEVHTVTATDLFVCSKQCLVCCQKMCTSC